MMSIIRWCPEAEHQYLFGRDRDVLDSTCQRLQRVGNASTQVLDICDASAVDAATTNSINMDQAAA